MKRKFSTRILQGGQPQGDGRATSKQYPKECPRTLLRATFNPIEILCAHAGRSLPDSLRERKAVLRAMEKVLRADQPVHGEVRSQLAGIAAVEELEVQLKLRFLGTSGRA